MQTDVAAEIGVEEAAGVVEVIAFHGASVKNELAEVVDRGGVDGGFLFPTHAVAIIETSVDVPFHLRSQVEAEGDKKRYVYVTEVVSEIYIAEMTAVF